MRRAISDVNLKDFLSTKLSSDSQNRHEFVKFLIENGADVNSKDKNGNTALISASSNRDLEIAKLLIENRADLNAKNKHGKTALMVALDFEKFGVLI